MNISLTAGLLRTKIKTRSEKGANGKASPNSQGTRDMCHQVHVFFYAKNFFMVGVLGSLRTCRFLDPILQPGASTTRRMQAFGGSNLITVKEAAMPKSHNLKPSNNVSDNYDLTYFLVVSRNKIASNFPISGLFETEEQARAILSKVKKAYPAALVIGRMDFFSSENEEGRKELINSIVKA